jgi:hypothetical protein
MDVTAKTAAGVRLDDVGIRGGHRKPVDVLDARRVEAVELAAETAFGQQAIELREDQGMERVDADREGLRFAQFDQRLANFVRHGKRAERKQRSILRVARAAP